MARKYFTNEYTVHKAILDGISRDLSFEQIATEVSNDFNAELGYKMYLKYARQFEEGMNHFFSCSEKNQGFSTQSFCEDLDLI